MENTPQVTVIMDISQYDSDLANCYTQIYTDNPKAWGTTPNSDLINLVPKPCGRILDFGCGYGKNFSHLLNDAEIVVGVDICPQALDLARGTYKKSLQSGKLQLILGDEDNMKGKYDFIISNGVLCDHLLDRRKKIVNRLTALLKPNGTILITVFGRNDPAYGLGELIEEDTYQHQFGFPVHYFTIEELKDLFKESIIINACYSKLKTDYYPIPHEHETHVLFGEKPI